MNNRKKLIVFIAFILVVVGGGFILAWMIPRNSVKKTGYKTKHNPSYIDDKMKEREQKKKSENR